MTIIINYDSYKRLPDRTIETQMNSLVLIDPNMKPVTIDAGVSKEIFDHDNKTIQLYTHIKKL